MKVYIEEQTVSGCIHHEYEIGSEQMFDTLSNECDKTTQVFGAGKEKKEVANIKFRAESTITNHVQNAFRTLGINNGREYSIMLAFRIVEKLLGNVKITMDFSSSAMRSAIACFLLCLFLVDMHLEQQNMRRTRRAAKTEHVYRIRGRKLET